MSLRNLEGLQPKDAQGHSKSSISQVFTSQIDPSLTWDFIAWVRSVSSLPIFVKVGSPPAIINTMLILICVVRRKLMFISLLQVAL